MSHSRGDSISLLNRHPDYYIDAGDLHVLAQRTLFRVHGYFFSRESPIFSRKLNPASPGDVREGTTDNDPVVLEDVSPAEFEKLLWVFYNPKYSLYDTSIDDWNCILNLADKWEFHEVKELAVRELHKKKDLDLVSKMALYQKYKVDPRHLVPLYAELCERDTSLTLEEATILGIESTVIVNTARERLRANPSDEGRSPLPPDLEEKDVFRAIELQLGMEEGSTAKFKEENPVSSSPTTATSPNGHTNGHSFKLPPNRGSVGKKGGRGAAR
ncbi:hypothetical protein GALMADRAFT_140117 [Galerina marginata CBS 339.88]|uniref:BTB domain-containing protein n=1 Tax=Galerina marginata (strain CBS 339.88) TaxID=685588 RepID=A0A067SX29_GALM3|nr:hypothetical protein GALMADRAFT_140117 [Galerina marginata CBS 339.88]